MYNMNKNNYRRLYLLNNSLYNMNKSKYRRVYLLNNSTLNNPTLKLQEKNKQKLFAKFSFIPSTVQN